MDTSSALVPYLPHCAVMLVLDTSHSMYRGSALNDLHRSLHAFFDSLAATSCRDAAVEVAAVGMGDDLRVLDGFRPYSDSRLPGMRIRPKGDTPIGGALRLALAEIDAWERKMKAYGAKCVPTQLVLLTDGVSTDDFTQEAKEIARRAAEGRLIVKAIAIGQSADRTSLARLAGSGIIDPTGDDMAGAFKVAAMDVSRRYERAAADGLRAVLPAWNTDVFRTCRFLVDGTNVLHWGPGNGVCLENVLALARALKAQGADYRVFFDATTPHTLRERGLPGDVALFDEILSKCGGRFVQAPAGVEADAFILMEADSNPRSVVVSQDLFRDRQKKYPWIRDSGRRVAGMVLDGEMLFPDIGLRVKLPSRCA